MKHTPTQWEENRPDKCVINTDLANTVAADTECCVVDPLLLLHLEEPGVAAGDPVVGAAPVPVTVQLAAGLAVDSPPVSSHQAVVL